MAIYLMTSTGVRLSQLLTMSPTQKNKEEVLIRNSSDISLICNELEPFVKRWTGDGIVYDPTIRYCLGDIYYVEQYDERFKNKWKLGFSSYGICIFLEVPWTFQDDCSERRYYFFVSDASKMWDLLLKDSILLRESRHQ